MPSKAVLTDSPLRTCSGGRQQSVQLERPIASGGHCMPVKTITDHERIWAEGLNRGDLSEARRTFAPDCVVHITGVAEPIHGIDAWTQFVGGLLAAFPDMQFTIEDEVGSGDRIAFRWHAIGTHTGPLGDVPPTGRSISVDGLIVDHLRNGLVVERWEQWDQPLMLAQLGLA